MLQLKTIHKNTLNLLKEISAIKDLDLFALAGGTSLSLQLGHRISIDLDFFTKEEFKPNDIITILKQHFELTDISTNINSLSLFINHNSQLVKIDFLRHNYPLLNRIITVNNIRLFSVEDIAAMKLNAIVNRGARKDFYDIYELLQHYSLLELINIYKQKYSEMNIFTLIKSLSYFDDANIEPEPISLRKITWENIKKFISLEEKKYIEQSKP